MTHPTSPPTPETRTKREKRKMRAMWSKTPRITLFGLATMIATATVATGCLDLIGYRDHVVGDPFGTGGQGGETSGGGTGGIGGTGGTGGTGGMTCEPGAMVACYSGPPGTETEGICQPGQQICNDEGSGFGQCVGEVVPAVETCGTTVDDDCDGSDCAIWSRVLGGSGNDYSPQVASDAAGNVFVLLRMGGSLPQADPPLINEGPADIALMKLDSTGALIWAQQIGNAVATVEGRLSVDFQGQPIVAGWFAGSLDVGGQSFTSVGDNGDAFVAKFTKDGAPIWAEKFGDMSFEVINDIVLDNLGNVHVVGAFDGVLQIGNNVSLVSYGGTDGFVAKLNGLSGVPLWGRSFGDSQYQMGRFVGVDDGGGVVIVGDFQGTINLGGEDIDDPLPAGHTFVARFDAFGNHVWSKPLPTEATLLDMATDPAGSVIMTGEYLADINLGGDTVVSAGGFDIWLTKWNELGEHAWTERFGGAGQETPTALQADDKGIVLISRGDGVVNFGGDNLIPAGGHDVFVLKLDALGGHVWSRRYGEEQGEACSGVATGPSGEVILGCGIQAAVDFGNGPLVLPSADGKYDAAAVKLAP